VTVLESRTGRVISSSIRHSSSLEWLQWDWEGRRLLTTGRNDEVLIWDAEIGSQVIPPLRTSGIRTSSARWSPDGRFIVTSSSDHKIRVWNTATGEMVTPPLEQSDYVAFAFMTRGNRVIAAIYGDQLRAWDLVETALPKEILVDYSRLLAGRYLDANGVMLTLPPQELAALCRSLRERAPQLFE
jgi:WD40 repeat protein